MQIRLPGTTAKINRLEVFRGNREKRGVRHEEQEKTRCLPVAVKAFMNEPDKKESKKTGAPYFLSGAAKAAYSWSTAAMKRQAIHSVRLLNIKAEAAIIRNEASTLKR